MQGGKWWKQKAATRFSMGSNTLEHKPMAPSESTYKNTYNTHWYRQFDNILAAKTKYAPVAKQLAAKQVVSNIKLYFHSYF